MTDPAPERNFAHTNQQPRLLHGLSSRRLHCARQQGLACSWRCRAVIVLILLAGACRVSAQALVFLVQAPVWAQSDVIFDAQPFAERLSATLGAPVVVRRSEDVLSHWRTVRDGRGFDLVFDEAHFTAYRVSHHGFTVLAQAEQEVRFAIVVRPRTLITAPSDLSARKVASPAPPALAALRLLRLFPDSMHAPVLVPAMTPQQALLALSMGEVSAAILPTTAAEMLSGVQIALETDASPGRAFSVSVSISAVQRRKLLELFRELTASAPGRAVLSGLAANRLQAVSSGVYEDAEQLLKGTWGY